MEIHETESSIDEEVHMLYYATISSALLGLAVVLIVSEEHRVYGLCNKQESQNPGIPREVNTTWSRCIQCTCRGLLL